MSGMPQIALDAHHIKTLYVDGKEFMILGGEIHNSSASSVGYMERKVWPFLKGLNMNTVIAPVYWETVESVRGEFDFSLVRQIVERARQEELKVIFLWFGLWKNGESTYIPGWMKQDEKTYFKCRFRDGRISTTISPFCREAVKEDRRAFVRLMDFIKAIDAQQHTVIMIQLENEIGFLGSDNDYSSCAREQYTKAIPAALAKQYNVQGTWQEAFGEQAVDYFLTWYFALAIEEIAAAGKAVYPLPIYINAWLELFPFRPGTYPTGGPIARMLPLWEALARSVDVFAPDIYASDFDAICNAYARDGNPLLIPEARRDKVTASNALYAFAEYKALGFSPFGVEDFLDPQANPPVDSQQLSGLNIDALAFCPTGTGAYLKETYWILQNIRELYFSQRDLVMGFLKENEHQKGRVIAFPQFDLVLTYQTKGLGDTGSAGMIIPISDFEFFIIGCNTSISVMPKIGLDQTACIERMEEGWFENSVFQTRRILNGDELRLCRLEAMPSVLKIKVLVLRED